MKQYVITLVNKFNLIATLRNYTLLTVGTLLIAFSFDLFSKTTNIAAGGVGGLALIAHHFFPAPFGIITLVLQIPAIILGFFYLGRFRFLISVWYVTMLYGISVDLIALYLPPEGITDDLLLNALYGGVVGGVGSGMIFLGQGAFAGTSIASRIIQLKTGLSLTQIYIVLDGSIIFAQGFFFGWEISLYAMIMLFVYGLATDYILEGPSVIRTAFIVTDSPERLSKALFERMGIGVTAWSSQGMFTKRQRTTLFCTVYRPDIQVLREIVLQTDAQAFIVIGQGHRASGGVLRPKRQVTPPVPTVQPTPPLEIYQPNGAIQPQSII